jgi:predicted  nucleic acid-binding Zn-ribbon protein
VANQTVKVVFEGKDQTSKAINSLKGNLNQASKAVDKIKSSLGGMVGALGAAAGAAGFGLMAKSALQTADALGKTSQKLGVTANELFKFQTQAELAGISSDTANMALQRFTRRTAEAAIGTGEAKAALEELRINADALQRLPLSERMKVLADAFSEVESPADRLRLAFKLFDSEGAAMVNMLEGGRESLEETEARMRELGISINSRSAPAVENFNDAVFLLQRRVQAAMIDGLGEAAPIMEDVADKLAEMAVPLTGKLLKGFQWLLSNLDTIVRGFKLLIGALVVMKVVQFTTAILALVKALGGMAAILAALGGPISLLIAGIGALGAVIYNFRSEIMDSVEALDDYLGITDKVSKAVKFFKGILGDSEDQVEDNTDTTKKATKETDNFEEAVDNLKDTVKKTDPPLEGFGDTVDYVATEEIRAAARTDAFREALEDLREAARTGADDIEDFQKEIADFEKTVNNTEATTEDFNDALLNSIEELTGVTFEARAVRQEIDKVKASIEALSKAEGDFNDELAVLNRRLEELGGELVEATKAADGLTASQREVLDEVKKTENEIKDLNDKLDDLGALYKKGAISAREYQIATEKVNAEIKELNQVDLTEFERSVRDAFDGSPVEEFFDKLDQVTGGTGALDSLVKDLIGAGGVKSAIANCFGTQPVTNFEEAVKRLFTGSGSALGGFGAALGNLTSALGGFFSGALSSFSSFKDAVVRTLEQIAAAAIASVGISFLKNLIPGLRDGGMVEGFATGGQVSGPGGPTADRVPAMLSDGEYVIRASSVNKFGARFFDALNSGRLPKFALGGLFGGTYGSIDNFDWFELFRTYFGPGDVSGTEGLAQGIANVVNTILTTMETFQTAIKTGVVDAINAVTDEMFGGKPTFTVDYVTEIIDKILEGVFDKLVEIAEKGDVINTEGNIFDRIREAIFKGGTFPNVSDEFSGPFQQSMIDELIRMISNLQSMILNFSFDDHVKKLFNRADGVVGGSLYLQGRQFGGPLERGQASMVGEDGPELFIPNRGGTVSPIKGNSVDLQQSINDMKDEIVMLRRQLSRELSGRRPAGVR